MLDWFEFKGVKCTVHGIRVTRQPEITRAQERVTFVTVPGRSGSLTVLEGPDVYDDLQLSVECVIPSTSQLDTILGWLRGAGTVTFANRPGGYYNARIVNQIPLEKILRGNPYRRFTLNFRCEPFFYISGVSDITLTQGASVTNPGNVFSEPKLTMWVTGDATVTVGAMVFTLSGLSGSIVVDGALKEVSKGVLPCNNKMEGDFPHLAPGINQVSWTGGITTLVITPRWRKL